MTNIRINTAGEWAWTSAGKSANINSGKAVDFLNCLHYGDTPLSGDRQALISELRSIGLDTSTLTVEGKEISSD